MLKTVYKTAKRRRTRRSTIAVTQGSLFDRDFVGTYNMVNIFTKEEGRILVQSACPVFAECTSLFA